MFCLVRKGCFPKSYWAGIKRNISKSAMLSNTYAVSSNKQRELLKNEQRWTNGTLLHLNKFQSTTAEHQEDLQKYMAVYDDIVNDLTASRNIISLPDVSRWFSEVLQYNVPNSNKYRAFMLMQSFRMLAEPEDKTPENIRLAMILGWCIDFFIASLLMTDDLMDGSEERRGVPCWYKKDGVGLAAVTDYFLLTGGYYAIIRKYFQDKPYYVNILETFHYLFMETAVGISSELRTDQSNNPKLDLFTVEQYKRFATYKTAFSTFVLPVELAMCLTGRTSEMKQAKPILLEMGYLHQVENDFHDCFGCSTVSRKIGSDIPNGKCTWLAVTALQKASSKQRKIIEECYGSSDPQKVAAVKDIYKELDLPNEYALFKDEIINNSRAEIQNISNERLQMIMFTILENLKVQLA